MYLGRILFKMNKSGFTPLAYVKTIIKHVLLLDPGFLTCELKTSRAIASSSPFFIVKWIRENIPEYFSYNISSCSITKGNSWFKSWLYLVYIDVRKINLVRHTPSCSLLNCLHWKSVNSNIISSKFQNETIFSLSKCK